MKLLTTPQTADGMPTGFFMSEANGSHGANYGWGITTSILRTPHEGVADEPAALADWRQQTGFMVTAAALSAAVIALILYLIIRQINRQNEEVQQQLANEKQRLDTALNNMTQGLVLYDSSARIVTFNRRYIDMYSLSTDVVKPGLHYYDLIQHRKNTGSYDGDVRAFCDPIMRNISEGRANSTIMETPDGSAYLIINKPLPAGGWVATASVPSRATSLDLPSETGGHG